MNQLDDKINTQFPGFVVRKDLVNLVKGNAIVPSYVLEYLLGQYCATSDEASIQSGMETVKEILRTHYVHRSEAGLIRSTIRERGRHKVIDKVSVDLNDKRDVYEATFASLGIKQVLVDADTIKRHPAHTAVFRCPGGYSRPGTLQVHRKPAGAVRGLSAACLGVVADPSLAADTDGCVRGRPRVCISGEG